MLNFNEKRRHCITKIQLYMKSITFEYGYLISLQHTWRSFVRWDATAYAVITQHHTITLAEYLRNDVLASRLSLQTDETHCAWSYRRILSPSQTVAEAHNGHLVPLACSQTPSFSVMGPTRERSSAAAQHGSASLPVLNETQTPGRSYTRLSNPIRSE